VSDSDVTMTCLNGVTTTVVPEKPFGSITVSCGARTVQQAFEDAQPRIEGEGKPSPEIREGR
jgi:hypothetical protein